MSFKHTDKREVKELLDDALKSFINQGKNDVVISLTENFRSLSMTDSSSTTLLHLAAKWGNTDLVMYLIDLGCDVNVKDYSNTTSLLMSMLYNRFDIAKLLLEADAEMDATNVNGKSALGVALNVKRRVPKEVVRHFYESLKRNGVDSEEIARKFLTAGCSLATAICMNDALLTLTILEKKESIDERESGEAVSVAVKESSLENMRVLLQYGPDLAERKSAFIHELSLRIEVSFPNIKFVKPFIDRLMDWKIIDNVFVTFLEGVFSFAAKEAIEIFLENNIDFYVKETFGIDLIFYLCGNLNQNIFELFQLRKVDINARNSYGQTVLHFAAKRHAIEIIQYLLDEMADPNAKDMHGVTPLYEVCVETSWRKIKCVELLLQGGADVQTIDNNGRTVFDIPSNTNALNVVLAQLAISQGQGTLIRQEICDAVQSRDQLKLTYDSLCDQIDEMKRHKISRSLNFFTVLAQKSMKIANSVRNHSVLLLNRDFFENGDWHQYYKSTIKMNMNKAVEIIDLRNKAAVTLHESVGHFVHLNYDNLAVENIVGFLNYKDLRNFS